jgi:hypothetical protein
LERLVADGGEEGITVGEVSVCGIGHNADFACYLAQDDRVRAAGAREFQTGLNERRSNSATWASTSGPREVARRCLDCCLLINRWHHPKNVVDSVHAGGYGGQCPQDDSQKGRPARADGRLDRRY